MQISIIAWKASDYARKSKNFQLKGTTSEDHNTSKEAENENDLKVIEAVNVVINDIDNNEETYIMYGGNLPSKITADELFENMKY